MKKMLFGVITFIIVVGGLIISLSPVYGYGYQMSYGYNNNMMSDYNYQYMHNYHHNSYGGYGYHMMGW